MGTSESGYGKWQIIAHVKFVKNCQVQNCDHLCGSELKMTNNWQYYMWLNFAFYKWWTELKMYKFKDALTCDSVGICYLCYLCYLYAADVIKSGIGAGNV